jgi:hypothetical protein
MSTQHTPGPWTYNAVKEGLLNITTGKQSEMHFAGFSITAKEPAMFGGTRIIEKGIRNEADACLIAAAPDMLTALREVQEAFDVLADVLTDPDSNEIIRAQSAEYCANKAMQLRAVASKAEGQS